MASRRTAAIVAAAALLAATLAGPAAADPDPPSEEDIEEARQAEEVAAAAVVEAEQRLAAIERELEELHIAAGLAVEAHNGAQVALAEAEAAAQEAADRAGQLAAEAELARDDLGRMAAASYRTGGPLAAWALVLQAAESDEFLDRTATLETATRSQGEISDRWRGASVEAEEAATDADAARADLADAEQLAAQAAADAADAVAQHESKLAEAEVEKENLLAALAEAQGTTVELERERQAALEEEARRQREEEARRQAEEEEARRQAEEEARATATPSPDSTTSPAPEPEPEPEPDPPSSGAEKAIEYAKAQLGKPYEWGADGPDSFDCSGLTMRAWEAGGVSLTHHSVAQANETTRVSYADLRPGDLIFWSNNGAPSGVYHVALYIGDGEMIHAPSSGKTVEIQDVFYWTTPSFYGRV
ncbi:MAG TPA: C40 family peptidase [Jiangellaceae bacterium]|nr:C40 family peptidase [Jiangellaceae bacterium]